MKLSELKEELLKDPEVRRHYERFDFWYWLRVKRDNLIIWFKTRGREET